MLGKQPPDDVSVETFVCPASANLLVVNDYNKSLEIGAINAKSIRDGAVEIGLAFVDDNYEAFINNLDSGRSIGNFLADLVELGGSAAVGITKGVRTLQIIGIGLTAFRGGRKSFDVNFFKEQSTPVLISQMDGSRANQEAIIRQQMEKSINQYSISSAVRDLVKYYNAGTLVRAFTELSKNTALQTDQSEKKVLHIKQINESDVVNIEPAVRSASRELQTFKEMYKSSLGSSDQALVTAATSELRNIYVDITTGDKKADFKNYLDEVRKSARYKTATADLDSDDAAKIASVKGIEILGIIFEMYRVANSNGASPSLTVTLNDIFVKNAKD